MQNVRNQNTSSARAKVIAIGQIESMTLPEDWLESYVDKPEGSPASLRLFHPTGEELAQLGFFYRGRRLAAKDGQAFCDLLRQSPHVLSGSELESIASLLRDKSDPEEFKLLIAKTEDFNGKRILVVEGRFLEISEDNRSIFIDSDGTGTAVQEVYFQAHKLLFGRYYRAAAAAMKTIKWKG